jgi:hypothetical protein
MYVVFDFIAFYCMLLLIYMYEVSFADNYLFFSFSPAGRPQPDQELCHEQGYIASRSVRTVYLVVVVE